MRCILLALLAPDKNQRLYPFARAADMPPPTRTQIRDPHLSRELAVQLSPRVAVRSLLSSAGSYVGIVSPQLFSADFFFHISYAPSTNQSPPPLSYIVKIFRGDSTTNRKIFKSIVKQVRKVTPYGRLSRSRFVSAVFAIIGIPILRASRISFHIPLEILSPNNQSSSIYRRRKHS